MTRTIIRSTLAVLAYFTGRLDSKNNRRRNARRCLTETLESRRLLAHLDFDDQTTEAIILGDLSETRSYSGRIDPFDDVDMFEFTAEQGKLIGLHVTSFTPRFLARLRLFGLSHHGTVEEINPGIHDPFSFRFLPAVSGTYWVGVSELDNETYSPTRGTGDIVSPKSTTGAYKLLVGRFTDKRVSFSSPSVVRRNEGNRGTTSISLSVTRSGAGLQSSSTTLSYRVTGSGTIAAQENDFVGARFPAGSVLFSAGETIKTITIPIQGDSTFEGDEQFNVTLSDVPDDTIISTGTAVVTIVNDDVSRPNLTAFRRYSPATSPVNNDTLIFRAAFDRQVTGVDPADFVVVGSTARPTRISQANGSHSTLYEITVSGGNLATLNGSVNLNLSPSASIFDASNVRLNRVEPPIDESLVVDNLPPRVISFERASSTPTNQDSLAFIATFSERVVGVQTNDFLASGTSGRVTAVSAVGGTDGRKYRVTLSGGDLASKNGRVGLNLSINPSIQDLARNPLTVREPAVDQMYLVDNVAPSAISFARKLPSSRQTESDVLVYLVTFSESVVGVDTFDFIVSGTSARVSKIVSVAGKNGRQYELTISGGNLASLNGTVGLNISSNRTIHDLSKNSLRPIEPSIDHLFTVLN